MLATLAAVSLISARRGGTLTVFAAASLKEAFSSIAKSYESSHPGWHVAISFAGSQTLAAQINQGAPADVFASADDRNLRKVRFDPASYRIFALNRLEIAARKGFQLQAPRDLVRAQALAVADPAVPVGHYTEGFFAKAAKTYGAAWLTQVRAHIVSREQDVKSVLAKVLLGEADAGIVYVSDVASAKGKVQGIPIPEDLNEDAVYPLAIPTEAPQPKQAHDFVKFLFARRSQVALAASGFISPLEPVSAIVIRRGSTERRLKLPVGSTLPEVKSAGFQGVSVLALPGLKSASSVTFVGADAYSATLSVSQLKVHKAMLVHTADGNYRLVVPGLDSKTWVNWVRRIVLK